MEVTLHLANTGIGYFFYVVGVYNDTLSSTQFMQSRMEYIIYISIQLYVTLFGYFI
jgi:hypothetical protein